jgi:hypothetical protein
MNTTGTSSEEDPILTTGGPATGTNENNTTNPDTLTTAGSNTAPESSSNPNTTTSDANPTTSLPEDKSSEDTDGDPQGTRDNIENAKNIIAGVEAYKKTDTGIIIGIIVAAIGAAAVLVTGGIALYRYRKKLPCFKRDEENSGNKDKKKKDDEEEEEDSYDDDDDDDKKKKKKKRKERHITVNIAFAGPVPEHGGAINFKIPQNVKDGDTIHIGQALKESVDLL